MKKIAAIMLTLLIAGISTGAAFAYLTARQTVDNVLTAADTEICITEKFDPPKEIQPGTVIPKTVAVTSSSSVDCYVRVLAEFSDRNAENFCEPLKIQEGWRKSEDGYYYWKEKVKPGETTGNLISEIVIKQDAQKTELKDFEVLIYAEAVACQEDSMQDAWKKMDGE